MLIAYKTSNVFLFEELEHCFSTRLSKYYHKFNLRRFVINSLFIIITIFMYFDDIKIEDAVVVLYKILYVDEL